MATQTPEQPASSPPGATPPGTGVDPVAQTLALLQPWIDFVPKPQRRLGLFIFLAFLAHAVAFFFIRIDTTRSELRHVAHIRVTMENLQAASPEVASADTFWDRMTDPRLFLLPMAPLASLSSDEPPLDFTSLNSSLGPQQLPPPAQAQNFEFIHQVVPSLEEQVELAMRPPRQPFFYDETPPAIAARTTWQWEGPLARRQPAGAPDLPSPVSDTDLNPTVLLVAVNARGMVEHALVEQTSEKPDLDRLVVIAARKIRFQPGDPPGLLWGRVTVFWHYAAKPREEVVPTPPTPP